MEIVVSRLSEDDVKSLQDLNRLFSDAFDDPENYHSTPPTEAYLGAFLRRTDTIVIVARKEERVVGGLVAYVLDKFEQDRREVYVYDVAVDPHFQRQGIGRKMMDEVRRIAREMHASVVYVQADKADDHAVAFYRSLDPSGESPMINFDFNE